MIIQDVKVGDFLTLSIPFVKEELSKENTLKVTGKTNDYIHCEYLDKHNAGILFDTQLGSYHKVSKNVVKKFLS